jgi:putative glutamine amidotransferase
VEAIEVPAKRYCLGVQWHPEYTWELFGHDRLLFKSLVDAAR